MSGDYLELGLQPLLQGFSFCEDFEESEVVVRVDVRDVDDAEVLQVAVDVSGADGFEELGEGAFSAVEQQVEAVVRGEADGRDVSEGRRHHRACAQEGDQWVVFEDELFFLGFGRFDAVEVRQLSGQELLEACDLRDVRVLAGRLLDDQVALLLGEDHELCAFQVLVTSGYLDRPQAGSRFSGLVQLRRVQVLRVGFGEVVWEALVQRADVVLELEGVDLGVQVFGVRAARLEVRVEGDAVEALVREDVADLLLERAHLGEQRLPRPGTPDGRLCRSRRSG